MTRKFPATKTAATERPGCCHYLPAAEAGYRRVGPAAGDPAVNPGPACRWGGPPEETPWPLARNPLGDDKFQAMMRTEQTTKEADRDRSLRKKRGRKIAGWFFIVLGVFGLFLPFLQGLLFIALGMGLLAGDSEALRRHLRQWKSDHPRWFPRSLEGLARDGSRTPDKEHKKPSPVPGAGNRS